MMRTQSRKPKIFLKSLTPHPNQRIIHTSQQGVKMALPMLFSEFKKSCEEHGYTSRVFSCKSHHGMFTRNGIKTEIKANHYTLGWGRIPEEVGILKDKLEGLGFPIKKQTDSCINVGFEQGVDILERFWEIVAIEEDIDSIVAKERGGIATKVFSREVAEEAIFEKIANRYFYAIENQDQYMLDMARTMLSGDDIDRLIIRGHSLARTDDDTYREHVVPCIMIHNEAIRMVLSKATVVEVAQMVATNLAIVLISNKEQELLDITKGWRTTMPDGWAFGNDPLARLIQAGIKLK
jgi:hypothetical protein